MKRQNPDARRQLGKPSVVAAERDSEQIDHAASVISLSTTARSSREWVAATAMRTAAPGISLRLPRRMLEASKVLQLHFVDHVIIGALR